jgi:hypothetical protein
MIHILYLYFFNFVTTSKSEKRATLKIDQAKTTTRIRFGDHFDVTRLMLTSNLKFKI